MKRFFKVVAFFLMIFTVAVVFVPSFVDWSAYKEQITRVVQEKTGLFLDIKGGFGFSVVPSPRFYIEKATLSTRNNDKEKDLIASFERLGVNLELSPLLKKQIKVSSLALVKPNFTLKKLKNGKLNIVTPEIEGLSSTKVNRINDKYSKQKNKKTSYDISLDQINVKEGIFTYVDQKTGLKTKIQNINLDLSANSLSGPFKAHGSVFYEGHALNIDAKIECYDPKNKLFPSKVKLALQPGDSVFDYDGVVLLGDTDGISLQGRTNIHIGNIKKTLSGFNTGSQISKISLNTLDTNGLLIANYKSLSYKNAEIKINNQPVKTSIAVRLSPFSYDIVIKTPKNGEIDLLQFSPKNYGFSKAKLNLAVTGDSKNVSLENSTISLDNTNINLSGSYKTFKNKQPHLSLNVKISDINYDKIAWKTAKTSDKLAQNNEPYPAIERSNKLPFDINLTASLDKLTFQKKVIHGIKTKVEIVQNKANIRSLSVQNIGKAQLKASGKISDFKNFAGITSYINLSSHDTKALAEWLDINTDSWPKQIKKANVKIKITGSKKALKITTNITSMGAKFIASGNIMDIVNNPAINSLEVQIKHQNMAKAIQLFSGVDINDSNLQKPLDFYSNVSQSGKAYIFEDIKGDLSGITVEGNAKVDFSGGTPNIKADLNFGTITIQSIVNKRKNSFSSVKNQNQGNIHIKQRWSKHAIDTSIFHIANLDIKISAKRINYGTWPLNEPHMTLKLNDGTLNIKDLNANIFGGKVNLLSQVQVANEVRSPLYFESTSSFKNVDIGKLFNALIGTKLVNISGTGSFDFSLKSSGVSPAALIYDLSGDGKIAGSDIILNGIDVAKFARALSDETKPGDTLIGLWKGSTSGGQTRFKTLKGAFTIQNGIVNIVSMTLDGDTAKVETKGQIDLPRWTISTKHPMSVKNKDGIGKKIPPFEISFNGSLDNPSQTFGQGLLQDYLQRKIQRKLDKLFGNSKNSNNEQNVAPNTMNIPEPQPAQHQSPEDALKAVAEDAFKGILQGLLH